MKNKDTFWGYRKQLKGTRQAIILDNRAFEDFSAGIITREELFEGSKQNNRMRNLTEIDMDRFERWVHGLGW